MDFAKKNSDMRQAKEIKKLLKETTSNINIIIYLEFFFS